jgi:uncharacterized protein
MPSKIRVVFDTNIYISAIIFGGNPRQSLELARNREIELITSKAILLELAEKLRDKFKWPEEDITEVIYGISIFAQIVNPKNRLKTIKSDPDDNKILEAALEGKVNYIVSGDKRDLISLKRFRNIPIITSKKFLDLLFVDTQ